MADIDTTRARVLDISKRQREPNEEHPHQADDITGRFEVLKRRKLVTARGDLVNLATKQEGEMPRFDRPNLALGLGCAALALLIAFLWQPV